MEQPKMRCCVKELDLTLQPRIIPRYKSWLPLATQQLRLRSLIQIIGHQLRANDKEEKCWFYYTLHRTNMSSPLYTSESIDNASPRWTSLEVPILQGTGHSNASEIIIRLWKSTVNEELSSDTIVFTWGVFFTGLTYIGSKLTSNLEALVHENSLIFRFHGGFFVPPFCLVNNTDPKRFLVMGINSFEIKDSYTVSKLSSLRSKMQALKQQIDSVQSLRERIASGESLIVPPKYPQSSLNRLLQPRKVNKEKKAEILKIRKDLEVAKFRTKLLEHERVRKMGEIRTLNQCHSDLIEENQDHGSNLMNRYRELSKDMERLYEWRQNHIDSRETYIQTTARLAHRRRQLITELSFIYPINQHEDERFAINGVHLPDSEDLESSNDTQVAVALGFVAHTTQMIANVLNVPTRYPIIHYGSRSKIVDHITGSLPETDRQFPLFARSKDKLQFHYAVYLLNKNIAQLRWYCGLPTADLRATLPNLSGLINVKHSQTLDSSKRTFSGSSLDVNLTSSKANAPLTPPIHKVLFDKCQRSGRSTANHFKGAKSLLSSSLDRGLNRPLLVQSRFLSSQSRRIYKSVESAIDSVAALPVNSGAQSLSSYETLNESVVHGSREEDDESSIVDRHVDRHVDRLRVNCPLVPVSLGARDNTITLVESDIEIMVPVSVSKPRASAEGNENSASARQRSSNSVSSCEMALSSSVVDEEDSSNGNSSMKNEESCYDGVFPTSQENVVKRISSGDGLDIEEETIDDRLEEGGCHADGTDGCCDTNLLAKSCPSHSLGNNTRDYTRSSGDIKDLRIDSQGNAMFSNDNGIAECDTDARQDQWQIQGSLECRSAAGSETIAKELASEPVSGSSLQDELTLSLREVQSKLQSSDYTSSTEYIDSIRRSSESVCARTEALANKSSSFKVMRPRL